ncbi:hypothetical protein TRVL_08962 [Trypanosoma vivax]|nr:hypothetical protein TRVL_08962 [Trypanosoma vivax]
MNIFSRRSRIPKPEAHESRVTLNTFAALTTRLPPSAQGTAATNRFLHARRQIGYGGWMVSGHVRVIVKDKQSTHAKSTEGCRQQLRLFRPDAVSRGAPVVASHIEGKGKHFSAL